jgi:hypothetical protein
MTEPSHPHPNRSRVLKLCYVCFSSAYTTMELPATPKLDYPPRMDASPQRLLSDLLRHCVKDKAPTISPNELPSISNISIYIHAKVNTTCPSPIKIPESILCNYPELQPPLTGYAWDGGPRFSGLDWADLLDCQARHLPDHLYGPAQRRALNCDDILEGFLAKGQRTRSVQGTSEDTIAQRPTLWQVVSILEANNCLGCLAGDNYREEDVEEGTILRSEMILTLILLLKQCCQWTPQNRSLTVSFLIPLPPGYSRVFQIANILFIGYYHHFDRIYCKSSLESPYHRLFRSFSTMYWSL